MSDLPEPGKPRDTGVPKSLLNDPDADVCPQFPVFRHPLFRKLRPFVYFGIPTLFVGLLLTVGPVPALIALGFGALFLILTIVFLVVSEQHALAAAAVRAANRLRKGWQFVCPGCLEAGPVRHACGACKEELEPFVILTHGWYLNDCAYCHARVFGSLWGRGARPNAYCSKCGHVSDTRHHQRQVRTMAVLDPRDLESLCEAVQGSMETADEVHFFFRDTGETMLYVADLGSEDGATLPAHHAGRQVTAVWLDAALQEPLRLGEALDRLIRKADLGEGRRREILLCSPHSELPPAVRNVVEGRFQRIELKVTAEAFFFGHEGAGSLDRSSIVVARLPEVEEPDAAQLTVRAG